MLIAKVAFILTISVDGCSNVRLVSVCHGVAGRGSVCYSGRFL